MVVLGESLEKVWTARVLKYIGVGICIFYAHLCGVYNMAEKRRRFVGGQAHMKWDVILILPRKRRGTATRLDEESFWDVRPRD